MSDMAATYMPHDRYHRHAKGYHKSSSISMFLRLYVNNQGIRLVKDQHRVIKIYASKMSRRL